MKKIKAKKLTREAFAPFGEYYNMLDPKDYALCGALHAFFPDRVTNSTVGAVGYSPIIVKKPKKYIVDCQEYHTTTCEMILPLDDDMLLHVAEKSAGTVNNATAKAFIVPKGTLIKLDAGVWHLAPLPVKEKEIHCMIILPECTYANDCTVVNLEEKDQFEIEL